MKQLFVTRTKSIKTLLLFAAVAIMAFSLPLQASANYYGIAQRSTTHHGSYFFATIQPMNSGWSSTNNTRFILHTTWIASGTKWIENGFVDGAMQEPGGTLQYHRGYYTATGDLADVAGTYKEYIITGPGTGVGTNRTFHIQRDGTNSWGVYVDFVLRRTYSGFATSASRADVGLETNTTVSTSNQWNERALQTYSGTSWNNWTSGNFVQSSGVGITVSWDTQYTSIFTQKTN